MYGAVPNIICYELLVGKLLIKVRLEKCDSKCTGDNKGDVECINDD